MTLDRSDAWPHLYRQLAAAGATILPADPASPTMAWSGLSETSTLGALTKHTGGVVLADGWVRLMGGHGTGSPRLRALDEVNDLGAGFFQVGFDVLGGVFALDGGAFGAGDGQVHYFAADSLRWEALELGYTALVSEFCSGWGEQFYTNLRWAGAADEIEALALDQGIAVYPFLCTEQSRPLEATSRRAVPIAELVSVHVDLARQLDGADPTPRPSLGEATPTA